MNRLFIAEKPSVGKAIAEALGKTKSDKGYCETKSGDVVTNIEMVPAAVEDTTAAPEETTVAPFALKLAITEDVRRCHNRADSHRHRFTL